MNRLNSISAQTSPFQIGESQTILMVFFDPRLLCDRSNLSHHMALTDVKIRAAKPAAKAYRLPDSGGLYLLIAPSGGKLWRWNYRFGGKQKTMPLGKYPDVTLADARTAHQAARSGLSNQNDPMAQRKADKDAAKAKVGHE